MFTSSAFQQWIQATIPKAVGSFGYINCCYGFLLIKLLFIQYSTQKLAQSRSIQHHSAHSLKLAKALGKAELDSNVEACETAMSRTCHTSTNKHDHIHNSIKNGPTTHPPTQPTNSTGHHPSVSVSPPRRGAASPSPRAARSLGAAPCPGWGTRTRASHEAPRGSVGDRRGVLGETWALRPPENFREKAEQLPKSPEQPAWAQHLWGPLGCELFLGIRPPKWCTMAMFAGSICDKQNTSRQKYHGLVNPNKGIFGGFLLSVEHHQERVPTQRRSTPIWVCHSGLDPVWCFPENPKRISESR